MTDLLVELRGFANPPPGWSNDMPGSVRASLLDLAISAATIGLSTWALMPGAQASKRSEQELAWRIYMLLSSIEDDGTDWVKSASYAQLDPTEKGAVSYFLGMAQADWALGHVLQLPFTAHIDHCLAACGEPVTGSRPDLLAFRGIGQAGARVECKGRTGAHDKTLISDAKRQAKVMPAITQASATTPIASISFFRSNNTWASLMVDPVPAPQTRSIPYEAVVYAHYWPLVTLVNALDPEQDTDGRVWGTESLTGFRLGVPAPIMGIFNEHDPSTLDSRLTAGRQILETIDLPQIDSVDRAQDGAPSEWLEAFGESQGRLDGCASDFSTDGLPRDTTRRDR